MAVGARPPLVAYNLNLNTDDVQVAKDIAKIIREKRRRTQVRQGHGL